MVDLKLKFPDDFFDEEIREGFKVTKKRKEVWAVELDLLVEFDRVCKKYDLKYSLDSGTLLGAVRHGGFIPWDDDIDVIIRREDYNKLCRVAEKEFKDYFFFQTEYTDPGSFRGHAQLRNSNTTGILTYEKQFNLSFNQGIFIDIFPVDVVIDNKKKLSKQVKILKKLRREINIYKYYYQYNFPHSNVKRLVEKTFFNIFFTDLSDYQYILDVYKKFEKICAMYNDINGKYYGYLCLEYYDISNFICPASGWNELIDLNFEFLKFPVISQYDTYLSTMYGDNYMTPVQANNAHGEVIFDTANSYTNYIK